jgi:GDP-L-fucose synthase
VVGFEGTISHDLSKPDGTPRKILDSFRLYRMGWSPQWELREGIVNAYEWFVDNNASVRMV